MPAEPAPLTSAIRTVGIAAKLRLHEAADLLDTLAAWLPTRGVEPVFEADTARLAASGGASYRTATRDELPWLADLVLVLGGDGTLLGMADRIGQAARDVPILGVNFGSLGFLTEITLPELYPALESAITGRAQVEERLMLQCRVLRHGTPVAEYCALNDVVVTRGSVSRAIDLSVWVDGQFVARFKADGIIVSSPTGSTAYNLAAGGPIVCPTVDAFLLTPIAPHTLTHRPVVLPATSEVRIQPLRESAPQDVHATIDGQISCSVETDDVVVVARHAVPLRLIRASTRNYFDVLRRKLRWAER
jgi:NAD+ kinase